MHQSLSKKDQHVHKALTRARWSILQTGLITTGATLFGVYVLGTRVPDPALLPMDWYVLHRIPLGAFLVGAAAAAGYLVGAQWMGLRIRGWLYVTVLLLQLIAYFTAHYAQFATLHLFYRNSDLPVGFFSYFTYATLAMGGSEANPILRQTWFCVLLRCIEALAFMLVAIFSPLVLRRKPRCFTCGGVTHSREAGSIASPKDLPHIAHLATLGPPADVRQLEFLLCPEPFRDPARLVMTLSRCSVCGTGALQSAANPPETPIVLSPQLTEKLWSRIQPI